MARYDYGKRREPSLEELRVAYDPSTDRSTVPGCHHPDRPPTTDWSQLSDKTIGTVALHGLDEELTAKFGEKDDGIAKFY